MSWLAILNFWFVFRVLFSASCDIGVDLPWVNRAYYSGFCDNYYHESLSALVRCKGTDLLHSNASSVHGRRLAPTLMWYVYLISVRVASNNSLLQVGVSESVTCLVRGCVELALFRMYILNSLPQKITWGRWLRPPLFPREYQDVNHCRCDRSSWRRHGCSVSSQLEFKPRQRARGWST